MAIMLLWSSLGWSGGVCSATFQWFTTAFRQGRHGDYDDVGPVKFTESVLELEYFRCRVEYRVIDNHIGIPSGRGILISFPGRINDSEFPPAMIGKGDRLD